MHARQSQNADLKIKQKARQMIKEVQRSVYNQRKSGQVIWIDVDRNAYENIGEKNKQTL